MTFDDYSSDLKFLNELLDEQQPNPYEILSRGDQLKRKEQAIELLKKDPSYTNFIKCLNRIGDGHLQYEIPDEFFYDQVEKASFFPFPIFIKNQRIFVNMKKGKIPYGSEIIKIQNNDSRELLKRFNQYLHGDKYNMTFTEEELISLFPHYYSTLIERKPKMFDIDYIDVNTEKVKSIKLPSVDYYEIYRFQKLAILPINKLEKESTIHRRHYKNIKLGVLTVNSFKLSEAYAYDEFSKFFKHANSENYNDVVIDLRNNRGGSPSIAAILFLFISKTNFKNLFSYRCSNIKIKGENLLDDYSNPAGEDDIRNFENYLYQRFDKTEDSLFVGNDRLKEGVLENFPPDKDNFKGNVYLIVGGNTFSAAVYFAKLFKDHGRGKIIGQETGGNENSIFAGFFINYRLPKTKLKVIIPITELFFDKDKESENGIIPDHKVSIKNYLKYSLLEKDPEIQYLFDEFLD